jgi:DNA-directed RNA polymerase subunit E'/Rpb7
VQDTSGDVIFSVTFKAITCLPEVNEVLDGKVIEVTSTGIQVQSGTIKCFITMKVKLETRL